MTSTEGLHTIARGSHVTLHYRVAVHDPAGEREVFSTFGARPATLLVGAGQLAAGLEERLLGLAEGDARDFELPASAAFGMRNEQMVQALGHAAFLAALGKAEPRTGEVVALRDAHGRQCSGVLKHLDDNRAVVDFNHPLAGLPVRFRVRIIGVL